MKISSGTIMRSVCFLLAAANQILVAFELSPLPIEDSNVELAISSIATVVSGAIAWWKNNDFSQAAKAGTAFMNMMRGRTAEEQLVDDGLLEDGTLLSEEGVMNIETEEVE